MTIIAGPAAALAILARTRDSEAWAEVVERSGPVLERLCARLTGDAELARDALQDTLLHIRDDARGFTVPAGDPDPDAAALRWMRRVAANTALQLLRRRRSLRGRERAAASRPGGSQRAPDEDLMRSEDHDALREELAALPQPMREAIILHHVEGLGFADVSAALRVPQGTAKVRVHRGLAVLRARLGRRGVACSILALAIGCRELPAVELPVGGSASTAIGHAVLGLRAKATTASLTGGLSMALKLCLAAAVVLAIVLAGESAAPIQRAQPSPVPPSVPPPAAEVPASPLPADALGRLARRQERPVVTDDGKGTVRTLLHAQRVEGWCVVDIAAVRLVLLDRSIDLRGESWNGVLLMSPNQLQESDITATGSSGRSRVVQEGRTGSTVRIGGLVITVTDGQLQVGGRSFDTLAAAPQLVLVGADGSVVQAVPLQEGGPTSPSRTAPLQGQDDGSHPIVIVPDEFAEQFLANLRKTWRIRIEERDGRRVAVLLGRADADHR